MNTSYVYTDADGEPLFRKTRTPDKDFFWETFKGGEWVSGRGGAECPLYNLPAVVKAIESGVGIWIVEGEKDADRLNSMGLVATTNPDGAGPGKWLTSYTRALVGAKVRIIADRDIIGQDHAQEIYKSLLGNAASIEIFEAAVDDVKGADVSDHLDAGLTLGELRPVEPDIAPGLGKLPDYPVRLIGGPLRQFVDWAIRDGLHAEAAGPAGLAALSAVCGDARMDAPISTTPALWLTIIGPSSSGKSPAIHHAFQEIDKENERIADENERLRAKYELDRQGDRHMIKPRSIPPLTGGNETPEALVRLLRKSNGVMAIVVDELDSFLSSMGAYSTSRRGGDADRARFREMWSGRPINYTRVGQGGENNQVEIHIGKPVLTIFGPLLPGDLYKLGGVTNGDWARWLPASVPPEVPKAPQFHEDKPKLWTQTVNELIRLRGKPRKWYLGDDAYQLFTDARDRWVTEQFDSPEHVSQALMKASDQVCRIAMVLAESAYPGRGGEIPAKAMASAIALVDYSMDVWRSLPGERSVLVSTPFERAEQNAVARLLAWIQRRPAVGGIRKATKREIMRAKVAGVKTSADVDQMLNAYVAEYPGTVKIDNDRHGPARVYITEPLTTG